MTTQEGNNAVVARHLEALANAAKEYTLAELANISVSGESYTLPTASETLKGGVKIGDGLQMDGDTLNVTIQSGSAGGTVGILGTVSSTVDGAFWYEVTDNIPALWIHKGNYDFRYSHDKFRFVGTVDDTLVAYLPFDVSTTVDACGNEWTAGGNPTIVDGALYLDGSSYLSRVGGITLGGQDFTIDFRLTYADGRYTNYTNFWGFGDGVYNRVATCSNTGSAPYILSLNEVHQAAANAYSFADTRHIATVYQHESLTLNLYIDGVRVVTLQTVIPRQTYPKFVIGAGDKGDYPTRGSINHFRIHDGVALWTENFTPPTAEDYL